MKISQVTPKKAVLEELGRRLAQYRKQQGLSQEALAKASGVGVATIRRIEDGRDAQIGSWIKLLVAMDAADAIEALLPEQLRSPMAEVKGRRRTRASSADGRSTPTWGDEDQ